jgi:two-component system chemotaxis sensor kinase CheA
MEDNREFIEEFLVESAENLDQLDRDLVALEKQPDDPERLASIFRTVHTIKGNSGFFGFAKLGALAHSGEHLLGRLRDGKLRLDGHVSGNLYSMIDAVRSILRSIEQTGKEGDSDYRDLARALAAVAAGDRAEPPGGPRPQSTTIPAPPATGEPGEPVDDGPRAPSAVVAAEPEASTATDDTVVRDAPETGQSLPPESPAPPKPAASGGHAQAVSESTIRVDVGLLASILDLVGELVLARNELRSVESEDPAVLAAAHRISGVTAALQEAAVRTRLQPLDQVFSKFPRTVRDLAKACGKEVQLVLDGGDTELDRSLVESIRDPLTHLIRNAIDHGLEPPEERERAGKPRGGRLSLRAFQESGQVTIEVADDGRGIDVAAVRTKAVARGLATAEQAATLPDEQVLRFIFEPGFSTARAVTDISGRGVGMDVVRTNIEAIGGTVDLASRAGRGTTVRVRVPLTLAIVPAVIVRVAGERFAIPQASVSELVPLRDGPGGPRIEGLATAPVLRVRGRLVPVVPLARFLELGSDAVHERGTVVLVRVDDHEFGLLVDGMRAGERGRDLLDAASITTVVVKPIGGLLATLGIYSGATVLGDGGVVLILDLRGVLRAARLPKIDRTDTGVLPAERAAFDRYLVCRTRAGRRLAVPLGAVVRLERYASTAIQPLGGRRVVRRGEGFTRIVDADEWLGDSRDVQVDVHQCRPPTPEDAPPFPVDVLAPAGAAGTVQLVVVDAGREEFAFAVDRIIDVETADSPLQQALDAIGVAGSLSLGGMATEVLDLTGGRPDPAGSTRS